MLRIHANNHPVRIVIMSFLFAAAMGWFCCPAVAEKKGGPLEAECDIHQTSCTKILKSCTVTLNIQPKPVKAMTDLTFTVTLDGEKPKETPYIDLGMPGMEMGPNRVSLKPTGNGTYKGKGIIVRCPSGRRTWKASVTIPDAGLAEFVFDAVY